MNSEPGLRHVQALRRADSTTYMSMLTLIHCSVSTPSKPDDTCIHYARGTLASHQETFRKYHQNDSELWEGYLTWYADLFCIICRPD